VTSDAQGAPFRTRLGALVGARTAINTAYRMIHPFLPAIARGLGVSLADVALIVSVRSALGIFSPPLGAMSDRLGRKIALLIGLTLFASSLAVVAVWPIYPVFFGAMILVNVGKLIFDSAMYALIGEQVDYARRGTALAIAEMSWSLAFLIGIPALGWMIQNYGLRSPFPVLAAIGLVMAYVLWRMLPADAPHREAHLPSIAQNLRIVAAHPVALAGMSFGLMISMANELIFIVYGDWMERTFDLSIAALGLASIVIGVAEFGGEGLVATLVDRIGKKRAVGIGAGLSALMCIGLPLVGRTLPGALVGLFFFFLSFEFTLVGSLPMMTELVPDARATVMAGNAAALAVGRALGALIGPLIFSGALIVNGGAAAALNLLALVVLILLVKID
jgi:MFS transporter, DHA1 family, inner membrane transport protein